jgi:hypothetical protein
MTPDASPFSIGLTYWPRRSAYRCWRDYDRGAARDELAHIAALGCDTVRLCLLWEDFQPGPQRLGAPAMRALEQTLDAAGAAGLKAACVLFPVAAAGALMLPAWANGVSVIDEFAGPAIGPSLAVQAPGSVPALYDGAYRLNYALDMFSYQPVIAAQRYLISEVVGYFSDHPALGAWQIGEGFERVRQPAGDAQVRSWFTSTADAVRAQRASARVLGVTTVRGLQLRAGPRPDQIAQACELVGVSTYPPEPPGQARRHPSFPLFLASLVAALAERPALVTSLGLPTGERPGGEWRDEHVYGRQVNLFYADAEQQASFLEVALERLYQAGAAGAWLTSYSDYPPELWRFPPLDRAPWARSTGLVDASGREKLSALALQKFAARTRAAQTRPAPPSADSIDLERYWSAPAQQFKELWREFDSA